MYATFVAFKATMDDKSWRVELLMFAKLTNGFMPVK